MKHPIGLLFVLAVLVASPRPTFGHHAGSNYDRTHTITVTGKVLEYVYTNPHVHMRLAVKENNGATSSWIAEADPPHRMFVAGWNRESLKPGDTVTVTGFPSKDGKKMIVTSRIAAPGLTWDRKIGEQKSPD